MKSKLAILAIILCSSGLIRAQQDLTIHYMQSIPQRGFNNPALIPDSRLHIGIPALSSVGVSYRNSLALEDIFIHTDDDSLLIDLETISEKLGPGNLFGLEVRQEMLNVGLRFGKNYLNVASAFNTSFRLSLPPDLVKFLAYGNAAFLGENLEIGGLALDFSQYIETSVAYSRQFTDALRIGIRGKYLLGLTNLSTQEMSIKFYTDPDDYSLTASSDIHIRTSFPLIADSINLGSLDSSFNLPDFNPKDMVSNLRANFNSGFAFDLGVNYKLSKRWSFNLAVLDIGSLNWTKNVRTINSDKSSFTFEGIDIYQMFNDSAEAGDKFKEILDSASSIFDFYITDGSFKQTLVPKIYVGATYSLTSGTIFGALGRAEYFNKKYYPSLTISLTKRLTRLLTVSGSYTIREKSFANVGAGLSLNFSSFQIYLLSDNATNFTYLDQTRSVNFRFGMNMTFGRKVKQNKPILDT